MNSKYMPNNAAPRGEQYGARVLDCFIDAISWQATLQTLSRWSQRRESRYVCICNVHSVITSRHDAAFGQALEHADMCTADGMPVTWMLRHIGFPDQQRINGPDLMWRYCALAEQRGEPIFFYGNTEHTLATLSQKLLQAFPRLQIAGTYAPPFRALTAAEDAAIVERINASGARIVFVSLGCPKQELWMAGMRGRIDAVMIGVGAAFDYHAGTLKRAPLWMQQNGLEWFYRLCAEPRRLWKRYFVTNSLFIAGALRQLALHKLKRQ